MKVFGFLGLVGLLAVAPVGVGADGFQNRPISNLYLVADALSQQNTSKADKRACLCYRVCEFQSRGSFGRGWKPAYTQKYANCPRLHEEVIYDNMANCGCDLWPSAPGPRTSPNH